MSSLENGLRILNLVSLDRPMLYVGEVCRELGLPKASVSRLLKTLAESGLLERDERDLGYFAGSRALALGSLYLARHGLMDLVTEAVSDLVREFGFTGHAGVLAGHERLLLVARQGSYPLQHTASVAERRPAFDSIIGRALLARLDDEEAIRTLYSGPVRGLLARVNRRQVKQELALIRRDRVARSTDLITDGITSIGVAVADPGRSETMGFCLSFPSNAASAEVQLRITDGVMKHAMTIGAKLRDPVWIT